MHAPPSPRLPDLLWETLVRACEESSRANDLLGLDVLLRPGADERGWVGRRTSDRLRTRRVFRLPNETHSWTRVAYEVMEPRDKFLP